MDQDRFELIKSLLRKEFDRQDLYSFSDQLKAQEIIDRTKDYGFTDLAEEMQRDLNFEIDYLKQTRNRK